MKSRLISILLSFTLIVSVTLPASASASELPSKSVEEILSEFHSRSFELTQSQTNRPSTLTDNTSESLASIRHETVNELLNLGYSAYEVTSSTYDTVEETLNTDLSNFGLQKDSSYIVIVGDTTAGTAQSRKTTGPSFYYTYGGIQYKLRTVTVTGNDSSNYIQTTPVNLLKSHTDEVVENMLNATIGAYATALGVPAIFGTIGSITGLTTVHFVSAQAATAVFQAGSAWTRVFTQVWDNNYETWVAGSSVEYVNKTCCINGMKYVASINACAPYMTEQKNDVSYSRNFDSDKWRNENAVIAFRGAFPNISDSVGDVHYTRDSKVIVTHRGGFL